MANLRNRRGIVTGEVRPGRFGEVVISVGLATETYYAQPYDEIEVISVGSEIVVVEHAPALTRTLLVTAVPDATAPTHSKGN